MDITKATRKLLISELEEKDRCPHCKKIGLAEELDNSGDLYCVCCGETVYKILPLPLVNPYNRPGSIPKLI